MRSRRPLVTTVLLSISFLPVQALVERSGSKDPRWIDLPRVDEVSQPLDIESTSPGAPAAARAFLTRHGGRWQFSVDPRTGLATLVQGEGIPFIPGPGNSLETVNGSKPTTRNVELATIRTMTDAFIRQNRDLIGPPSGRLVLDPDTTGPVEGGRLIQVHYRWMLGDAPVEGAGVFVAINSGNVIQFGAPLVGSTDLDPTPSVTREEATSRVLAYSGDLEAVEIEGEPELRVQPEGASGNRLSYRLVWVVRYRSPGGIETWEGRVDAHTGQVVAFRDVNAYGRVVGGIYPRTVIDPETKVPFPFARVDSPTVSTDLGGFFGYSGGLVQSGLNGTYFNTDCQTCSTPTQPIVFTQTGIGSLDFGSGGTDAAGNGASTKADRNTFFHLNQIRRVCKRWLPNLAWLNTVVGARVNIQSTCNAYWDGLTVNFYRSGGGCNNTGEISDVVQHEWGHGIDQNTRGGDGATGEATADIAALHLSHDAHVGPYFTVGGGSVRDLDKNRRGLITRLNVAAFCPAGSGPLGREVHCEGEIYGQTHWDLVQALIAKHGHYTGWRTAERIFFTSLPSAGSYLATGAFPIYNAYLAADDDDGNLANGTPNGAEIYQAFAGHAIAGAAAVSSPGCARPAQPAVTVTPLCDRLSLSWGAEPGADHYEILRAEARMDTAYFRVGSVPAGQTTFDDLEAGPATDYWYVVMAVSPSGCESTVESPLPGRLTPQPVLTVTAALADDTPRGNRSGFADPGEEVDLRLTFANVGEVPSDPITGTIVAVTPGVTVLSGADVWPSLAPGASATNSGVLRFVADPALVACGQRVRFSIVPTGGSICPAAASYFEILMGRPGSPVVCDPTPACYVLPTFAGLSSAAPGASCGDTVLAWEGAASNCTNATISYNVYRSTDPAFVPGPQNRIAGSVIGTGFGEGFLAPGATFYYVVRANDSRSGEESNEVRQAVVVPVSPDVAPPVFPGLASATAGTACGVTALSWAQAVESCGLAPVSYDVYRSTDPAFTPDPTSLVATTFSLSFTDVAPVPGTNYSYVVRARDAFGNADGNTVRRQVTAPSFDLLLSRETFEANDGGWGTIAPNDAVQGRWEWGDPEGTFIQPENDYTPDPGHSCWVTGLASLGGIANNDVDAGSTTLRSARYDLSAAVSPFVRFARWFKNDNGPAPGEDPMTLQVSNDDGASWIATLDAVSGGTPFAWVVAQSDVTVPRTANMRFAFFARDLINPSNVEAAIDDFEIWDRGQGCGGCPQPVQTVGTIFVSRSGNDVVLDWAQDPVQGSRYAIYKLTGPGLGTAIRVGTTTSRTFVHPGAVLATESFFYRVSAVDACGGESALE